MRRRGMQLAVNGRSRRHFVVGGLAGAVGLAGLVSGLGPPVAPQALPLTRPGPAPKRRHPGPRAADGRYAAHDHMSLRLSWWVVLSVVVALAASWALLASQDAVAQTPTDESPRTTESSPMLEGNDRQVPRDERGDESGAAAADEDSAPLLEIILTLGVLLLVLAFGMSVHPRGRRAPKRLRERLSVLWEPSPLYRAAEVPGSAPSGLVSKASAAAKRSNRADLEKKRSSPDKAKRLPTPKKPPRKPAKPAGAVKPQRIPKPPRPGKPSAGAKSPAALKLTKPAPSAKPGTSTRVKRPANAATRRRVQSRSHRVELRPVDERSPRVADTQLTRRTVTCSIFGWRDGEVADFYAVAFGLQGRDWILERSPQFSWPTGDVPAEAYVAHAKLVDALVREGWRPVGNEGAWYRQRFERAIEPVSGRA